MCICVHIYIYIYIIQCVCVYITNITRISPSHLFENSIWEFYSIGVRESRLSLFSATYKAKLRTAHMGQVQPEP